MILKYFLLSLLSYSTCFFGHSFAHEAVVGGTIAKPNELHYQVAVMIHYKHRCGGGIISDQAILTAAHCVFDDHGKFEDHMTILAGTNDLDHHHKKQGAFIRVKKIYVPEEYAHVTSGAFADIAILKLTESLSHHHLHLTPLQLPQNEREIFAGKKAVIAGWGWDHDTVVNGVEDGGNTDSLLRVAEVDVIANKQCQQDYARREIPPNFICARVVQYNHKQRGVCLGDSGGPLVHGNTVIGVLSLGVYGCDENKKPAIYTSVAHYLPFIHNAMNNHVHGIRMHDVRH